MPQVRDPDMFLDAIVQERHHAAPAAPPSPKAVRAAKRSVWEPKENILGVLWRLMQCADIQRLTGLDAVVVARTLLELQRERKVRESAPGLWEKIIP
jgi:hypothetical protein